MKMLPQWSSTYAGPVGGEEYRQASYGGTPDQIYRARAGLPLRTVQLQCSLYARISRGVGLNESRWLQSGRRRHSEDDNRVVLILIFPRSSSLSTMRHFGRNCAFLAVLLATASARSAETNPTNSIDEETASSPGNSNVFGELRQIYQVYKECSDQELSPCLKVRLLSVVERMYRSMELNVADGVTFVRDDQVATDEPPKSIQEIEVNLPRALDDKEDALNTMIFDKVVKFFQSHTLKLKLPNVEELQRSLVEEGRKKKKNMSGLLAIPLLIGGTLVPLALGALAILAGKALIVSKLALVLASIIGLKKLVSGGGDHGHEVVQVGGGHGSSGWARSSHDLAYSAYKPAST